MCGICLGEPCRGVTALFNGDLQAKGRFADRGDCSVVSERIIVYLGESSLGNKQRPLVRGCDEALATLTFGELEILEALSRKWSRPPTGSP